MIGVFVALDLFFLSFWAAMIISDVLPIGSGGPRGGFYAAVKFFLIHHGGSSL